jgi:hypothetical protein
MDLSLSSCKNKDTYSGGSQRRSNVRSMELHEFKTLFARRSGFALILFTVMNEPQINRTEIILHRKPLALAAGADCQQ